MIDQPGNASDELAEIGATVEALDIDRLTFNEMKAVLAQVIAENNQIRTAHNEVAMAVQRQQGQLDVLLKQQQQLAVAFGRLTTDTANALGIKQTTN